MQSGALGIDNCIALGLESHEGFQKQHAQFSFMCMPFCFLCTIGDSWCTCGGRYTRLDEYYTMAPSEDKCKIALILHESSHFFVLLACPSAFVCNRALDMNNCFLVAGGSLLEQAICLLVWQLHCLQCLVSKDGQRVTRVSQGEERERERERDESLGAMTNLNIGDVKVFVCGKTLWAWYRDSSIVPLVCLSMI